jgi:2-phosphosulfolactate phosphatase
MPSVVIDCFQESTFRYRRFATIVVVDVFRATTTATTALATGRRVFPARSTDEAFVVASTLDNPILVGEIGGNMPYGFDMTNTPAGIAVQPETERPMVLLSSSGTELIMAAAGARALAISCFRNFTAVAEWIVRQESEDVAVLGAGTRGQFRIEDQMGCSWVASLLVEAGFAPATPQTREYIYRWRDAAPEEALRSESAAYLKNSNQQPDIDFVMAHIDDLILVPVLRNYELVAAEE